MAIEAEHRAELEAILRGDAPFTWEAWSRRVHTAPSLTDAGRACVLAAVADIAKYLRADWLNRFRGAELPLLSMQWWLNDAPHVYARILEFGLRLKLLQGCSGIGKLRKMMAHDLGSFGHAMLQIEVAALALRDGWAVTLEPDTDGGRADLLVERPGDGFLVEVKGFDVDQTTGADMQNSRRISDALLAIERSKDVSVVGDIGAVTADDVAEWERLVAEAADQCLQLGEAVRVSGPTGVLRVHPTPHMEGKHFGVGIRHGDEWARVLGAVDTKAEQARSGDLPVWLRFDESTLFWALHIPSHHLGRPKCLAAMAASLHDTSRRHPHLAGVVLSLAPAAGGATEQEWWTTRERSVYVALPTNPPYHREALVVPGTHDRATTHRDVWRRWYRGEPTWLEWALDVHGLPGLGDLFVGEGIEPYLAARQAEASTVLE